MAEQSPFNTELTNYFNAMIGAIINPENLLLNKGNKPFESITSLHYNKSTETLYIEQEDLMYVINYDKQSNHLMGYAYKKLGVMEV